MRAPHTWSWGERSTTLDSWEVACVSTPQFKHLFTVHSPTASLCTKYGCSYNSKSKCIQPLLLRTVKSRLLLFLKESVIFFGGGDGKTCIWALNTNKFYALYEKVWINIVCLWFNVLCVNICSYVNASLYICMCVLLYMCMRTFVCLKVHITPSIDLSMFSFMITSMISICEPFLKRLVSVKQFIALNLLKP